VKKVQSGLQLNLCESAGTVDGTRTHRPYDADAFDELVCYSFDWKAKRAHRWQIPVAKLIEMGYIRTDDWPGTMSLYVYTRATDMQGTATWTFDYYKGTTPIGNVPAEAEAAAGHLLDELRSGEVV